MTLWTLTLIQIIVVQLCCRKRNTCFTNISCSYSRLLGRSWWEEWLASLWRQIVKEQQKRLTECVKSWDTAGSIILPAWYVLVHSISVKINIERSQIHKLAVVCQLLYMYFLYIAEWYVKQPTNHQCACCAYGLGTERIIHSKYFKVACTSGPFSKKI